MSLCQKMSGMNDLVITKAGWVKFREVLSPKGKLSKTQIKYKGWRDVWMMLRKCGEYLKIQSLSFIINIQGTENCIHNRETSYKRSC